MKIYKNFGACNEVIFVFKYCNLFWLVILMPASIHRYQIKTQGQSFG